MLGIRSNILHGFTRCANQIIFVSLYGPSKLVKHELQPQNLGSSSFLIAISVVKRKILVKNTVIGKILLWFKSYLNYL